MQLAPQHAAQEARHEQRVPQRVHRHRDPKPRVRQPHLQQDAEQRQGDPQLRRREGPPHPGQELAHGGEHQHRAAVELHQVPQRHAPGRDPVIEEQPRQGPKQPGAHPGEADLRGPDQHEHHP